MRKSLSTKLLWVEGLILLLFATFPTGVGLREGGNIQAQSIRESPTEALDVFFLSLRVESPLRHEELLLFPLTTSRIMDYRNYLTLGEALAQGVLIIRELPGNAQVNWVEMENRSSRYVFLLSGEILEGAKQDRTVQEDTLLPPHSGKIRVRVFCTERGRWGGPTLQFEKSAVMVPQRVRQVAKETKSQTQVWESIRSAQGAAGMPLSSTQAAKDTYQAPRLREGMESYVKALGSLPRLHRYTVGVVAVYGSRILAADAFGNPELLDKLYPKLLKSYLADVLTRPRPRPLPGGGSPHLVPPIPKPIVGIDDVERFLRRARNAPRRQGETDGVGRMLEIRGVDVRGSALIYRESVVHLDLFPALTFMPIPLQEREREPNLRFRREQEWQR